MVVWNGMIQVRTSVEKVAENSGTEKDFPEQVYGMGLKEGWRLWFDKHTI